MLRSKTYDMKQFAFAICVVLCMAVNSQEIDCNQVKNGVFKSVVNVNGKEFVSIITRKNNKQQEESLNTGVVLEFVVKWTSKCTYELSNPKIIKGEMPNVSSSHVLFVRIIDVKKDSYSADVSSNFFDNKIILDFTKIK